MNKTLGRSKDINFMMYGDNMNSNVTHCNTDSDQNTIKIPQSLISAQQQTLPIHPIIYKFIF